MKDINWFHLVMFVVLSCGFGWVVYIIRTEVTELGDLVGLGVVAALCLFFGLFSLIMAFFEKKMMRAMYGEFSNRNHRGV